MSRQRKGNRSNQGGYQEPMALGDLVPGVLGGMKPKRDDRLRRLRAAWPQVVGPQAAERTRLVAFDQGVLRVDVASAALKHDLATFRREEILAALEKRLGGGRIRAVQYRVSDLS